MQLKADKKTKTSLLTATEFHNLITALYMGAVDHIAVATSGGCDSMALSLLLKKWCDDQNIKLTALSVDHGLRDGSKAEVDQVAIWMAAHNINHKILNWTGDKPNSNIQGEARKARYGLMGNYCADQNIKHLFLAHHQQDQAETFLLRLFRGSGVDGLSAMQKIADFPYQNSTKDYPKIYRPLLDVSKEYLQEIMKEAGQAWIEDPSNEDPVYSRIKVRQLLKSSQIEGLNSQRLSATATRMRRVRSLLDQLSEQGELDYVKYHEFGFAVLNSDFADNLHEEISLRILREIVRKISADQYGPRLTKLETLYQNLKNKDFSGQTILGSMVFKAKNNDIIFVREISLIDEVKTIADKQQYLWDNRFLLSFEQYFGTVRKIDDECYGKIKQEFPDFKENLKALSDDHTIRNCLLSTLPCLVLEDGTVRLPDILCDKITMPELYGFSAVLNK